jgi:phosphoribosylanthranilate isomerase
MLIKASRITNLTDARYFAAKEVDFLGFNLDEGTEGYLDPVYMKAIREWVEGPGIVGEFSYAPVPYIREAANFFGLDAVQVAPVYASRLNELDGLKVMLEIEADMEETAGGIPQILRETAPFVSYFVLKWHSDMPLPAGLNLAGSPKPVLLHTDAGAEQLAALLQAIRPAGLSMTGGEEERTGVKSFDQIEEIFEALGRYS